MGGLSRGVGWGEKRTVENFVLPHTVRIPVAAEADHHQAVFLGHDGLVDVPAGFEVREDDGTHVGGVRCGGSEVCGKRGGAGFVGAAVKKKGVKGVAMVRRPSSERSGISRELLRGSEASRMVMRLKVSHVME